jgi:hypothetical protein
MDSRLFLRHYSYSYTDAAVGFTFNAFLHNANAVITGCLTILSFLSLPLLENNGRFLRLLPSALLYEC